MHGFTNVAMYTSGGVNEGRHIYPMQCERPDKRHRGKPAWVDVYPFPLQTLTIWGIGTLAVAPPSSEMLKEAGCSDMSRDLAFLYVAL